LLYRATQRKHYSNFRLLKHPPLKPFFVYKPPLGEGGGFLQAKLINIFIIQIIKLK